MLLHDFQVHHGGNLLTNFPNLNLLMALCNCEYLEVLQPDGRDKYGLLPSPGACSCAAGVWLGAKIELELIARKQIAVPS